MVIEELRQLLRDLHKLLPCGPDAVTAAMARQERQNGEYTASSGFRKSDLPRTHQGVWEAIQIFGPWGANSWADSNAEQTPHDSPANFRTLFTPERASVDQGQGRPLLDALEQARQINARAAGLITELPVATLSRLGLAPRPSDWVEALLRLGHHFPHAGVAVERFRVPIPSPGTNKQKPLPEKEFAGVPRAKRREAFPGVVVSRLGDSTNFLTASAAGVRLLLEALDGLGRHQLPEPDGGFASLHAAFEGSTHRDEVKVRWLRLTDPICTPVDDTWGRPPRDWKTASGVWVLARHDSDQVICQLGGIGADEYLRLATAAGQLLPRWPATPFSAVFARPAALSAWFERRGEPDTVAPSSELSWAENDGMVTDHRGPLERWLGFILKTLVRHEPQLLSFRPRPEGDPEGCEGVIELIPNPFAGSARAIELAELKPLAEAGMIGRQSLQPTTHAVADACADDQSDGLSHPTRPGGSGRSDTQARRLKGPEAVVLRILSEAVPSLLTAREIHNVWPSGCDIEKPSIRTLQLVLARLCEERPKLAHRRNGPRSGATITPHGRRALAHQAPTP